MNASQYSDTEMNIWAKCIPSCPSRKRGGAQITTEFVGFIPQSLVLRSIVLGRILIPSKLVYFMAIRQIGTPYKFIQGDT